MVMSTEPIEVFLASVIHGLPKVITDCTCIFNGGPGNHCRVEHMGQQFLEMIADLLPTCVCVRAGVTRSQIVHTVHVKMTTYIHVFKTFKFT